MFLCVSVEMGNQNFEMYIERKTLRIFRIPKNIKLLTGIKIKILICTRKYECINAAERPTDANI